MNNYFINIIRGLNLKSSIKCATKVLNSIASKFDDHVSIKKIKEFFQDITSVTLILKLFDQCSIYGKTRYLVFTSKMFEKHLWQSDILSKDAGQ